MTHAEEGVREAVLLPDGIDGRSVTRRKSVEGVASLYDVLRLSDQGLVEEQDQEKPG